MRPVAWEPPYAAGVALKERQKKTKKKKKKKKKAMSESIFDTAYSLFKNSQAKYFLLFGEIQTNIINSRFWKLILLVSNRQTRMRRVFFQLRFCMKWYDDKTQTLIFKCILLHGIYEKY